MAMGCPGYADGFSPGCLTARHGPGMAWQTHDNLFHTSSSGMLDVHTATRDRLRLDPGADALQTISDTPAANAGCRNTVKH